MAIIVDHGTRLVVQGLTGSEGRFHGLRNRRYGTQVVAGVTPGKGGTDVDGIPVFDTVGEATAATRKTCASMTAAISYSSRGATARVAPIAMAARWNSILL